jgi:UDP-glucose 4-epimerase
MKIIVTGANGFVGKALIRRLEELGFDAWAVVRKKTHRDKEIVLDFGYCSEEEIFEKLDGADCVVHLAANADFRNDFNKEIYDVNCLANLALANVLKRLDAHFIFASNALIAGMHEEYISKMSKDNPLIPYNISKYISEQYIMKHVRDYCILRIGGIYGYNGPEHLFLNRAISHAINNNQLLSIQNDGLGMRNYIYVEDLCSWIIHIIKSRTLGKYLVAGKETLALKEMFLHINNVLLVGKGQLSLNLLVRSTDQIIEFNPPDILIHDYQSAFNDIKYKLQNS